MKVSKELENAAARVRQLLCDRAKIERALNVANEQSEACQAEMASELKAIGEAEAEAELTGVPAPKTSWGDRRNRLEILQAKEQALKARILGIGDELAAARQFLAKRMDETIAQIVVDYLAEYDDAAKRFLAVAAAGFAIESLYLGGPGLEACADLRAHRGIRFEGLRKLAVFDPMEGTSISTPTGETLTHGGGPLMFPVWDPFDIGSNGKDHLGREPLANPAVSRRVRELAPVSDLLSLLRD